MTQRPRFPRFIAFAASVFALAFSFLAAFSACREIRVQGYWELGFRGLACEVWRQQTPFVPSLGAGAAALFLALVVWRVATTGPGRLLAAAIGIIGHPLVLLGTLLLAFALPHLAAACLRPAPPENAPNVLFVLVDTWRADHAGFLGYERAVSPNLDLSTKEGIVFERAIAQAPWTKPSVATLLTGLMPSVHRAQSQPVAGLSVRGTSLPRERTTLIEVLAASGWQTAMWSSNPNIQRERGFAQGAEHFVDLFHDPARSASSDPRRIEHVLSLASHWLETERDPSRPFCAYVHVMDPHFPYDAPPPAKGTFQRSDLDFQLTGPIVDGYLEGERDPAAMSAERLRALIDAYDEELLHVDRHLGPFLAAVRARFPNTVIVLVGDHGEEFREHGQFGHGHALWEELVHVPLVLWGPSLAPARIPSQVRLMDVFPSVLELCGVGAIAARLAIQGQSLAPVIAGRETTHRCAPYETGGDQRPPWQWRGLCDGELKLLRREEDLPTAKPIAPLYPADLGPRPRVELYDLAKDPGERANLAAERPEEAAALFERMRAEGWWFPPTTVLQSRVGSGIQAGDHSALQNLGYAGAATKAEPGKKRQAEKQ